MRSRCFPNPGCLAVGSRVVACALTCSCGSWLHPRASCWQVRQAPTATRDNMRGKWERATLLGAATCQGMWAQHAPHAGLLGHPNKESEPQTTQNLHTGVSRQTWREGASRRWQFLGAPRPDSFLSDPGSQPRRRHHGEAQGKSRLHRGSPPMCGISASCDPLCAPPQSIKTSAYFSRFQASPLPGDGRRGGMEWRDGAASAAGARRSGPAPAGGTRASWRQCQR